MRLLIPRRPAFYHVRDLCCAGGYGLHADVWRLRSRRRRRRALTGSSRAGGRGRGGPSGILLPCTIGLSCRRAARTARRVRASLILCWSRSSPTCRTAPCWRAVCALSFLSGGYVLVRMTPVVIALAVAFAVWVWLGPRRRPGIAYIIGLAGLALYALWAAVSISWSIGPDLSWIAADYALLLRRSSLSSPAAATAGAGQVRLAGYGYVVVAVPVAVYAFLGKVLPDRVEHAHVYARLSDPLGYWNVLAIMMVFAIVARGRGRRASRDAGRPARPRLRRDGALRTHSRLRLLARRHPGPDRRPGRLLRAQPTSA